MITLILAAAAAAVLLPAATGSTCCFPDKVAGEFYGPEVQEAVEFVGDYSRGKFYSSPLNKSTIVEWVLADVHAGEQYMKYTDGRCRKVKTADPAFYDQCIPSKATKLGHAYLGPKGHLDATAWHYKIGEVEITSVVSKDCYPVLFIGKVHENTFTNIYVDVTANPSHSQLSVLDQDVSKCTDLDVVG